MKNRKFFDEITDRTGTHSIKWDRVKEGGLAMWIADMDFRTPQAVTDSIIKRAENGIFGYTDIPDEWYCAYQKWWKDRYNFSINKEWLIFTTGVIPDISSIIRKMTTPAENVVVMTPVYNMFFDSILDNGRNVLESRLVYNDGKYSIDFADLEEKLANPQTSMMILCNPHNPTGNIWDRDILDKIGKLCKKYHVLVVSDEIHCDITKPGISYIPFASVSDVCRDNCITCVAPTKTFNIAGIQTAAVIVADENIRQRVITGLETDHLAETNVFAADAAAAAYSEGGEWLDDLREYLWENRQFAEKFIKERIPQIKPVESDATYLMWLDCTDIASDSDELKDFICERSGLYVSSGSAYRSNGGFLRFNIACPQKMLEDGLKRLEKSVKEWKCS